VSTTAVARGSGEAYGDYRPNDLFRVTIRPARSSLKGALIPIVALTRGFPLAPVGGPEPGDRSHDG
jgi:hypothetical protein